MALWNDAASLFGSVLPYSLKFWEWHEHTWTADNVGDVRGKTCIVTGATGGVGLETCYELVRNGAHVFMGARSAKKFRVAQDTIRRRLSREQPTSDEDVMLFGRIEFLPCDLSSVAQAHEAAQHFLRQPHVDRLDVFVACAGRGAGKGPPGKDGVEPFMATNCVNHMVMIRALLPLLIKTAQRSTTKTSSRIVFVSSVAHFWCSIPRPFALPVTFASLDEVNDPRRTEGMLYGQSKLAQILMVKRLALEVGRIAQTFDEQSGGGDVACLAIHPGEINNHFVQQHFVASTNRLGLLSYLGQFRILLRLFLLNAREGARTCLFAATAREVDVQRWRGEYLTYPCQRVNASQRATDELLGQRCWDLVNNVIDANLPDASKAPWS